MSMKLIAKKARVTCGEFVVTTRIFSCSETKEPIVRNRFYFDHQAERLDNFLKGKNETTIVRLHTFCC